MSSPRVLRMVVTMPLAFLLLYAVLLVCFRRKGAASVD